MGNFHVSAVSSGRRAKSTFGTMVLMPCLFFLALVMTGCAANQYPVSSSDSSHGDYKSEERLGIRIEGLRLSAAGNMLDLRYRVYDPVKAAPLFDRRVGPYLLDEKSGAAFGVPESPKVGQLRTTRRNSDALAARDYHIIFANPGHRLQAGQKVSLVVGEMKLENLSVE